MSRRQKFASVLLASILTGVVAVEVAPSPVKAANFDGAWSAVGNGMPDGTVFQIVTDADGSIYAAGTFTSASGVASTRNVAMWNGTAWTAVGGGVTTAGPNGASGGLYALALDPGANAATSDDVIYVGGEVAGVGGVTVNRAAKWNGTAWSALGATGATSNGVNNTSATWDGVEEIVVVSSTEVYIGGNFDNAYAAAGGVVGDTAGIAKWNGTTLSPVGNGIDGGVNGDPIVNGMTKDASGNIIATGQFEKVDGSTIDALRVGKWNGTTWSRFGGPTQGVSAGVVAAVATAANGDVFIGGTFSSVNQVGTVVANTNRIAMWDASFNAWVSIGNVAGTNPVIEELRVIGNYLYAGGAFTSIGGVSANNIARMNLTTKAWEALVSGCLNGVQGAVRSIIDAGNGAVYVAGGFTDAGGVAAADRIAKFTPGAAAGCGGGFVTLDSPTKFVISRIEWGVRVGGKNGLLTTVSWTAPTGANAPSFYKVTVDKATDQQTDGSFSNITPYPELDCWATENSCRIFLAYASNGGFGTTEARFTLYGYSFNGATTPLVIDPPGPYTPALTSGVPTDVRAVNGWNTVTVSWTPPAETGTYPITNYLVISNPGRRTCITSTTASGITPSECTYKTLTPGTNYTFTVQALNGGGWGDKSEATATGISPQNIQITKFTRNRVRFLFINRGSDIVAEGFAPGYPAGTSLTAWVKYGNSTQWQPIGDVKVSAFGTFSWKRRFPTNQDRTAIAVTFTQGNNQGNEVTLAAVR